MQGNLDARSDCRWLKEKLDRKTHERSNFRTSSYAPFNARNNTRVKIDRYWKWRSDDLRLTSLSGKFSVNPVPARQDIVL